MTETKNEDINGQLRGGPYRKGGLYAGFTARFSSLPTRLGTYLAHFKDSTTGFRCRAFATTNGAAAGSLRIGVAAAGTTPTATASQDLSLNNEYRVVLRYSVVDGVSTVWVNPATEADTATVSTDTTT